MGFNRDREVAIRSGQPLDFVQEDGFCLLHVGPSITCSFLLDTVKEDSSLLQYGIASDEFWRRRTGTG